MEIRRVLSFLQSVSLVMALSNCAGLLSPPPPNPVASPQQNLVTTQKQPLFYDFQDIPVPAEMTLQAADSYVYQAGQSKVGVQLFRGRVDLASLVKFFQLGLPHYGWVAKGEFDHYELLLVFEKTGKICVINLHNDVFYAYAKVWVIQTSGEP